MVPVVVPAVLEYVMPLRVWLEWVVLVAASWCWHTVGSPGTKHGLPLVGCGWLLGSSGSGGAACVRGVAGAAGLFFENFTVDASIFVSSF